MVKVALLLLAMGLSVPALAAPVASAEGNGVIVTLTDEPCALPGVANLPYRATWLEKGVVTEGCFGGQSGVAMLYFADRTVVAIPGQQFRRVTPI